MSLTPQQAIDAAYKELTDAKRDFSTAELIKRGRELQYASKLESIRMKSIPSSITPSPLHGHSHSTKSLSPTILSILESDVVEFLGYEEFWSTLHSKRERDIASSVYNRVRDSIRKSLL